MTASPMIDIALPAAGVLTLILLCADVFENVFHSSGRGGLLSRPLMRGIWHMFRKTATKKNPPRDHLMSLAGAWIVLSTLAGWIALLVVGFAAIYYPWIETFLVSPGELRWHWVEALYYSGYTAATLGFGDVIPDLQVFRLLAPLEAFGGFALLSVSITYVLAIYRELVATQTLSSKIHGYLRANDPLSCDERYTQEIARWMEGVTSDLLHVVNSHYEYPLLHYFRSSSEERALPPQIRKLDDLRNAISREGHALAGHPSLRSLSDALDSYLETIGELFIPDDGFEHEPEGTDRDPRVQELLEYMGYRTER